MTSLFFKLGSLMPVSMNQALWPFTLDSGVQYRENVGKNGWKNREIWSILSLSLSLSLPPPLPPLSFDTK